MTHPRPIVCAATLCVLILAGCAGPADDAGDDALASLPTWTLTELSRRDLSDDGSPERVFSRIIPARLPSGDLLVADGASKELRIFRDGALATRLSRQGDGPGELQDIQRISLTGDTVFVMALPIVSRQVHRFTVANGFAGRFTLRAQDGAPSVLPLGRLTTGEFVVEEGRGFTILNQAPDIGQLLPDSVTLGIFRPGGSDSTGQYQSITRLQRHLSVAHAAPGPVPFGVTAVALRARMSWAVAGDRIWVADGATDTLRAYAGDGTLAAEVALGLAARPFDPGAIERARASAASAAPNDDQRAAIEATYDLAVAPAAMPLIDALVPGTGGEVWARRYQVEPGRPQEYLVVNREGHLMARVTVPADITVHQAGADFIVGVRRDADGVESVVEYGLTRR